MRARARVCSPTRATYGRNRQVGGRAGRLCVYSNVGRRIPCLEDIYRVVDAIHSPRFRTSDTTGTRCIVTGRHRERARLRMQRDAKSLEREDNLSFGIRPLSERSLSLPLFFSLQCARMHLKLASRVDLVRIHRADARNAPRTSLHRRCIHQRAHQQIRRAIKSRAKSLRDIKYFSRCVQLSQYAHKQMQYPVEATNVIKNALWYCLISQNIRRRAV